MLNEKEMNLIKNKKKSIRYNIKVGFTKLKKLRISVNEFKDKEDTLFERKLDYMDLIEIDNYFALYTNIEEIIVELDELIVNNDIILTPVDDQKKLLFEFDVEVNDKPRRVSIILFKKFNEQMDTLNKITKLLYEQNEKINAMTKDNDSLRNELEKLNKRVKEKEDEKIVFESESIKGTKDRNEQDNLSELDRDKLRIPERNNEVAFISPKNDEEMKKCDPDKIIQNTKILNHVKELFFLIKKINKNISYTSKQFFNMKLIYRASEDGDTAKVFHKKCDGISPLLVLIKTIKHRRFGGFTQSSYESTDDFQGKQDGSAFIFTLDKLRCYDVQEGQNAICCCKNNGPIFYGNESCNIYLGDNFFETKGNVAKKGDRYNTKEDYELNFGKPSFITKEIEIYQIYLTKLE